MAYRILDADGKALDAHLEIEGGHIRFHSRGGTTGTSNARNTDYSAGLRAVLDQLRSAGISITDAFVDSGRVQTISLEDRRILSAQDADLAPAEQFVCLSQRMRRVGRTSEKPGGNNNKLIRLCTDSTPDGLRTALSLEGVAVNLRSANRIPDAEFRSVRADHLWEAVEELRLLTDFAPYGPSKDYDVVLEDKTRLPPKAVFGRAASKALGIAVLPKHFSGGVGTVCFDIIEDAGFAIVAKTAELPVAEIPPSEEEWWAEGSATLKKHMRKERARGLAQAKKSAFIRENGGKLFCEECQFEPIKEHNDPLAEACIEVHHRSTMVSLMAEGHKTKLSDLQCLCASCHRLVHARLRSGERKANEAGELL